MPEEIKEDKRCATCGKDEAQTGKPCPTRTGCFTPDYKNWEPIAEVDKDNPGWKINYLTFDNENSHVTVSLSSVSGGCIMVEMSPDEIAKFAIT